MACARRAMIERMKAISIRVAHKGKGQAASQRRHDTRTGPQPGYVDAERKNLNSVLVEPMKEAALRDECESRRSQRPGIRAMASNAAVATTGILTFGHEAQRVLAGLTPEQQDQRILEATKAAAAHMGTTLTGLVVHRDESALHAHFQCPAVRLDGRPVSKALNREGTSQMQDVAAQAFEDLGITRGTKKKERQARGEPRSAWVHRKVTELHDDLPKEIAKARAKAEKNRRLVEQTQAKIDAGNGDLTKLKKRLKTYQKREADALAVFEKVPEPVEVERITGRTRRAWGLLPDRVEITRTKVYSPKAAKAATVQAGERIKQEAEQRAALLDVREQRIQRREKEAPRLRKEAEAAKQETAEAKAETAQARQERDGYLEEVSKAGQALRSIGKALTGVPGAEKALERIPGQVGNEMRLGMLIGRKEAQKAAQAAKRPERDNGPELGM